MNQRGRFDHLGRKGALAVLAAFAALVIWGLISGSTLNVKYDPTKPERFDSALYMQIVHKMASGEGYYRAVDEIQAKIGYPTRPFLTVREPTLAVVTTWLGGIRHMDILLAVVVVGTLTLLALRLERIAPSRAAWWSSCAIAAIVVGPLAVGNAVLSHELWAGLLLALSLTFSVGKYWWLSVFLAVMAAMVRELALPVFAVMAVIEIVNGRVRRSIVWIAAGAGFLAFFALHATRVAHEVAPSATVSLGWLKFNGWPFWVDSVRYSSILAILPLWVAAVAVPVSLVGWISRRGEFARNVTVLIVVYALCFGFVGRPENTYWGLLYVVLLLPGMAFAPAAMRDLWRRVRLGERDS